jgi:hypothetical protein
MAVRAIPKCYSSIYLEGLRKTTTQSVSIVKYPDKDLNKALLEYLSEVLLLESTYIF